jgi:hypothetical protein
MDITITISERAEQAIREQADENGKNVENFVEDFVEQTFTNGPESERRNNLLAFAGMFSSGRTDTSERMSEILKETDFDPAEGFSIR